MHELALGTAIVVGFTGSLHCVAMCGGLTTAFSAVRGGNVRWQALLYQFGRITSYALGGGIAGAAGAVAGAGFENSHWGALLRIGTALTIVLIGLNLVLKSGSQARWLRTPERWGTLLWRRVAPGVRARLPRNPVLYAFSFGMLWGWLPCGLVYSVLLVAAFSGSAAGGSVTMVAFGVGTLPALLGLNYVSTRWLQQRAKFAPVIGSLIVGAGLWTAALPIGELTGAHNHTHHTNIRTLR
jgi:sulfite exporter TauE/SafE